MKLFLILMLLGIASVQAEILSNLYDAEVPVADRGSRELNRGTAAALEEVLIRMSGRQDAGRNPAVRGAMQSARNFLQKYSYRSSDDQLLLQTRFSGVQVNRLLEQAALPVWSANRPAVLVWLVVDGDGGRRLIKPETDPELVEQLAAHARRRGIPLVYPLYDFLDSGALPLSTLWNLDIEAVVEASERYRPGSILVGRLTSLSDGHWQGDWRFSLDGVSSATDAAGAGDAFAAAPLNLAANQLGAKFAITSWQGSSNSMLIELTGITGFGDYADAVTYLEAVAGIEHANMVYQSGSKLIVELVLAGTLEKAEQFFELDGKLKAVEIPYWQQAPAQPDAATRAAIDELTGAPSNDLYTAPALPVPGLGTDAVAAPVVIPPPAAAKTYQWLGSRG